MSDNRVDPDWYPDPGGSGGERWWDGQAWTNITREPHPSRPANVPGRAGWYPDPDGSGAQRWWDGYQWTPQRMPAVQNPYGPAGYPPHTSQSWLQRIKDTGPRQVQKGSSRAVAGIAIIAAGLALFLSALLEWGSTMVGGYRIAMNGFGQVTVSGPDDVLSSFLRRQLQADVESAVQSPGVWVAFVGVVSVLAGAAYLWTVWRSHSALAVTILGGIAFLASVGNFVNLAAMMGHTASYSEDYAVGFGLLAACALTFALVALGITAFVLERISLNSR
ncbi:DUF2510 domain-containing protein [Mycolicibacterium sp. XJ1819]